MQKNRVNIYLLHRHLLIFTRFLVPLQISVVGVFRTQALYNVGQTSIHGYLPLLSKCDPHG